MRTYFTEANYKHTYEAMKLVGTLIEERGLTDELDGIHTSLWLILMKCERQREKKVLNHIGQG